VVTATLNPAPRAARRDALDSPTAGRRAGISFATVARVWRKWDLQPWRVETFRFSTDPELEAKARDVVGLDLNPPEHAVVLCLDEKTQVQALQPAHQGEHERLGHTHDRKFDVGISGGSGEAAGGCSPRRCRTGWDRPWSAMVFTPSR
jgi:hypothetical protein